MSTWLHQIMQHRNRLHPYMPLVSGISRICADVAGGMTKLILQVALLSVMTACSTQKQSQISDLENALPKVQFQPTSPERWVMSNGMVVLFLPDFDVPLVAGSLFFRGGALFEPANMIGVAEATGAQMRSGGTKSFGPRDLDLHLDALAAAIESSFSSEYGSVGFSSLRENLDDVFPIFSDIVRQPRFDANRLELWKSQAKAQIVRRKDDPQIIASMTFMELMYGKASPYSRWPTEASLSKLNVAALKSFHKQFVRPDQSILAVSGAISRKELEALLDKHFATWPVPSSPSVPYPEVVANKNPGIYVVRKKFDQTSVMLGHLGPSRLYPEIFVGSVFNKIFGQGGFGSILNDRIRTAKGLAYSVYGGLFPSEKRGLFSIEMATRNAAVPDALGELYGIVDRVRSEAPTEEQLRESIDAAKKGFVFKFETPAQSVERRAYIELLGYPEDFDKQYVEKVDAVSDTDVLRCAQTWIHPDELVTVVVGDVSSQDLAKTFSGRADVYDVDFDMSPSEPRRVYGVDR